jgi:hypothetical protein
MGIFLYPRGFLPIWRITKKNGIIVVEAGAMDRKLICKMIQNCFRQYYSDTDSLPLNKEDMDMLCNEIVKIKCEEPTIDLYEVVNDLVYEFITK